MTDEPNAMVAGVVKMLAKAFGSKASGADVDALLLAGAGVIRDLRSLATGGEIMGQSFPGLVKIAENLDRMSESLDRQAEAHGVEYRIIDAEFEEAA